MALIRTSCVLIVTIAAAGCSTNCEPKTPDELAAAATDESCRDIIISHTSLQDLTGLEQMTDPRFLDIQHNDELSDISAVDGAASVLLLFNPSLTEIDLHVRNGLTAAHSALDRIALELDPLEMIGGEPQERRAICDSATKVSLACKAGATCRGVRLRVADPAQRTFTVGDDVSVDLEISEMMTGWEPLQGVGVPDSVHLERPQDDELAGAYRAWLLENGFTGQFAICENFSECVNFEG